ncbi:SH3 domain-containing protein [Phascolarctobacterium sp.]|uniref:SH3 domain-containing protein n=1 Tax=Phascolarctobacterium sp. TaxID=2049039 RepID=UPI002A80B9F1|nr:SH3 domain-containing protein [Phascolarctobacterium sp.]MDY5044395.1 SH3 domain-containing protein [Phascolarctobacterium sp.]
MHRKIIGSVLLGLCMFANSALAALPKEGVYEKHSAAGTLEARMFVMGEHGATKYTFGYGNDYTQIIWLEGYTFNGERHSEFATKYVWKTDSVGAAETALILDREGIENLKNGDIATPIYAQDMAVFSFDDNGMAKVNVRPGFTGEPESWKNGNTAASLSGKYNYVANNLKFTPISLAYVHESTCNPDRFYKAEAVNQEWNQEKIRINANGTRYECVENLMERGYLVKIDATLGNDVNMRGWTGRGVLLGSEVRMRANTTTDAKIVGMLDLNESVEVLGYEKGLDGRGWYYVKKENGLEGFAAAQFIDLR